MKAYRLTPSAVRDLQDIHDYVARDNLRAAGRMLHRFREALRLLRGIVGPPTEVFAREF